MKNKKEKSHFKSEDRIKLELLLSERWTYREISKKIGFSIGSISEEIRNNSVKGEYTAKKAVHKARQRRFLAKFQTMKIVKDKALRKYVEERIKRFWSPEDIAGRIKFIDKDIQHVNKDSIYKYIRSPHGTGLLEYLWFSGKSGKPAQKRTDIENRKFIDQRPLKVLFRKDFWDWEADFIVSGGDGKGALLVFIERRSRHILIFKLNNRKVETINSVLRKVFGSGQLICNTLTIDNDICFKHHKQMEKIIGGLVFFCHPYHSWEKGSVEKVNQRIRRFVKKGADIDKVPEERIKYIEEILNNKPYKCLGFHTPKEVLSRSKKAKEFISKISGLNIQKLHMMQEIICEKCSV
ncbi:MAG: IS30 family transposase [Candidatus Pacebacteria bacterium]|nr:IS30 family transposase [Candidatus Paceibacterota bacterium]